MKTLPPPGDALHDAGDLLALATALVSALKAEHVGYAANLAGILSEKALRLRYRLIAADCGIEHIGTLVAAELERLADGDAV